MVKENENLHSQCSFGRVKTAPVLRALGIIMKIFTRNEFVLLTIKITLLLVAIYAVYVVYIKLSPSWKGLLLLILFISVILIVRSMVTTIKSIYAKYTKNLSIRSLALLNTLGFMFNIIVTLLAGAMVYKGYSVEPVSIISAVIMIIVMAARDHYTNFIKESDVKS